jgi:hypothetical protein
MISSMMHSFPSDRRFAGCSFSFASSFNGNVYADAAAFTEHDGVIEFR